MAIVQKFRSDRSGSTLPVFGVSIAVVLMMVGYAVSLAFDSNAASRLQLAADNAALSGATAFIAPVTGTADDHLERAEGAADAFVASLVDFSPKRVSVSAVTSDAYGQHVSVDVELEYSPANPAARMTGQSGAASVVRYARAEATRHFPLCILTLSEGPKGLSLLNQAELDAAPCAIWSNSPGREAIGMNSGTRLISQSTCAVGDLKPVQGNATPEPIGNCQRIPDPLASLTIPTGGFCDETDFLEKNVGGTVNVRPGIYCGGLRAEAETVEFEPGTYVIRDGPLYMKGTRYVRGNGVVFLLSGDNAYLRFEVHNELNIVGPATGPMAGLVIAEDRTTRALDADGKETGLPLHSSFQGNGEFWIEGGIYLPGQDLAFRGRGGSVKSSPYLQIVANKINLSGNRRLEIRFEPTETALPIVIEPKRIARLVK